MNLLVFRARGVFYVQIRMFALIRRVRVYFTCTPRGEMGWLGCQQGETR